MPAEYNTGDMLEIQILGAIYNSTTMNVVHMATKTGPTNSIAVGLHMDTQWIQQVRSVVSSSFRWTAYKIRRVSPEPKTDYETVLCTTPIPQGSGGAFPPQLCTLWALKTVDANVPPRKGRLYLPAVPGTAWVDGAWTSTWINTNNTVMAALLARFKAGGTSVLLNWMVRSKEGGGASVINNILLRSQPAVQRSRRIELT